MHGSAIELVSLTAPGRPPRTATQCRISSWFVVVLLSPAMHASSFADSYRRGMRLNRPGRGELAARLREVLGEDLHVREDRHEVRIARPARDEVQVDVVDDPRACDAAEIPAEVVALRGERLRERADAGAREPVDLH